MKELLKIKNLHVSAEGREILKGINLSIGFGQVHVIMGPNGAGKSTLASSILSNPHFEKTSGTIVLDGEDITSKSTTEIARAGVFMSFQNPEEIEGISVFNFIKTAKNKITGKNIFYGDLQKELGKTSKALKISEGMLERDLNVGFSGGEKKKNEILQMVSLSPKLAILDETDSGLDVDAIKLVSKGINLYKNDKNAILIITHSTKILQYIDVDYVHVLVGGKIVASGDAKLAKEIEEKGFDSFKGKRNA